MASPPLPPAVAEGLIQVGRALDLRGWLPATSGNLSARLAPGWCALTASGVHKGRMTAADLLVVDMAGQAADGRRPSAETALHTALYLRDARCGAVLHVHSPGSTWVSRWLVERGQAWLELEGWEILKAFPGVSTHEERRRVAVIPNSQDVPSMARQAEPLLAHPEALPALLIGGHGLYTWGVDVDAAWRHLEAVELLLEVLRFPGAAS